MFILFDFDGTLVDSFNAVVEKTILLSKELHLKKLDAHEIEHLRDLSSKEIIKFLQIPTVKIPQFIYKIRHHLRNEIIKLPPSVNIYPTLEKLFFAKFSLGILTSNSVENVTAWLDAQQMRHFFSFIHSESRFLSKKYLLKKTLYQYHIDKSDIFYIGDETRDIDAAHKNKVKSIAVTWGYQSEKILTTFQPSFIAKKPQDILSICGL